MANAVLGFTAASNVIKDALRRIDKGAKARPPASYQTPDDAKSQQRYHAIAKPEMPGQRAAANQARYRGTGDASDQAPVEKPGWQIPDPDFMKRFLRFHTHSIFV